MIPDPTKEEGTLLFFALLRALTSASMVTKEGLIDSTKPVISSSSKESAFRWA